MIKELPTLKVEQPGGTLYLFKISAKELLNASYISRRSEQAKGIQRILKKSRLKKIADFIESEDALFPNSIIVSIDDPKASFEPLEKGSDIGHLKFSLEPNSVMIIDGQHRLHGFEDERTEKDFDVIVAAFLDTNLEKEAYVFYKVNKEAKPVNTSLALDLLGLIGPGEDFLGFQLHKVIRTLNEDRDSPLCNTVSMTDVREPGKPFTQANLSTKIKWFLKSSEGSIFLINADEIEKKHLVNLLKIYFDIIKELQSDAWEDEDSLLRTNLILGSLIYLLPDVLYATKMKYRGKVTKKGLKEILDPIQELDFSRETEEFSGFQGEAGMKEISKKIAREIGLGSVEGTFDL